MQHTETRCNTLQHTYSSEQYTRYQDMRAARIKTLAHKDTATYFNTLQHTAIHCNTHATHCNTLQHTHSPEQYTCYQDMRAARLKTLQHTATRCNTHIHLQSQPRAVHALSRHASSAPKDAHYTQGTCARDSSRVERS